MSSKNQAPILNKSTSLTENVQPLPAYCPSPEVFPRALALDAKLARTFRWSEPDTPSRGVQCTDMKAQSGGIYDFLISLHHSSSSARKDGHYVTRGIIAGRRVSVNVEGTDMLLLDGDDVHGENYKQQLSEVLGDCVRATWTSFSNGHFKDNGGKCADGMSRVKTAIFFSRTLTEEEDVAFFVEFARRMGSVLGADDCGKTRAQPQYTVRRNPKGSDPWMTLEGSKLLDPDALPWGGSVGELVAQAKLAAAAKKASQAPQARATFDGDVEEEMERAEIALEFVDGSTRVNWLKMGICFKNVFGEDGYVIWKAWSALFSGYDAKTQRQQWDSFPPQGKGKITLGSLYKLAKEGGYVKSFVPKMHNAYDDDLWQSTVVTDDTTEALQCKEGEAVSKASIAAVATLAVLAPPTTLSQLLEPVIEALTATTAEESEAVVPVLARETTQDKAVANAELIKRAKLPVLVDWYCSPIPDVTADGRNELVILTGGTGSRKTTEVKVYVNNSEAVMVLAPSRALTRGISDLMSIACYSDLKGEITVKKCAVCYLSAQRIPNFDVNDDMILRQLVLEEWGENRTIGHSKIAGDVSGLIYSSVAILVLAATQVVAVGAYTTWGDVDELRRIKKLEWWQVTIIGPEPHGEFPGGSDARIEALKAMIIDAPPSNAKGVHHGRTFNIFDLKSGLIEGIKTTAILGGDGTVYCTTKTDVTALRAALIACGVSEDEILCITGDSKGDTVHTTAEWSKYRWILYNQAVGSGVSVHLPNHTMWVLGKWSSYVTDAMLGQGMFRNRTPMNNTINMWIEEHKGNTPRTWKEVYATENKLLKKELRRLKVAHLDENGQLVVGDIYQAHLESKVDVLATHSQRSSKVKKAVLDMLRRDGAIINEMPSMGDDAVKRTNKEFKGYKTAISELEVTQCCNAKAVSYETLRARSGDASADLTPEERLEVNRGYTVNFFGEAVFNDDGSIRSDLIKDSLKYRNIWKQVWTTVNLGLLHSYDGRELLNSADIKSMAGGFFAQLQYQGLKVLTLRRIYDFIDPRINALFASLDTGVAGRPQEVGSLLSCITKTIPREESDPAHPTPATTTLPSLQPLPGLPNLKPLKNPSISFTAESLKASGFLTKLLALNAEVDLKRLLGLDVHKAVKEDKPHLFANAALKKSLVVTKITRPKIPGTQKNAPRGKALDLVKTAANFELAKHCNAVVRHKERLDLLAIEPSLQKSVHCKQNLPSSVVSTPSLFKASLPSSHPSSPASSLPTTLPASSPSQPPRSPATPPSPLALPASPSQPGLSQALSPSPAVLALLARTDAQGTSWTLPAESFVTTLRIIAVTLPTPPSIQEVLEYAWINCRDQWNKAAKPSSSLVPG